MYRKIAFLLLFIQTLVWSQDFSRDWVSHFSYNDIVTVANSDTKIFAAANNSIFIHSVFDNTNTEFTTVNGLSAQDIEVVKFIEDKELIVVGFSNGLVEIINEGTGEVTSLNDIPAVTGFPPDNIRVNDFFESDGILYIATGFGVVEYDLNSKIFRNTYLISDSLAVISNVISIGAIGDFIFASIEGRGTFIGNRRDQNLILFNNWSSIQADEFVEYDLFSGRLIARDTTNNIYEFNNTSFEVSYTNTDPIIDFSITNGTLNVASENKLTVLNGRFENLRDITFPDELQGEISNILFLNNEIYFSEPQQGFFRTNNLSFNEKQNINPDGPLENSGFSIEISEGDLWLSYGRVSEIYSFGGSFFTDTHGLSRLRNEEWLNIPFEDFDARRILDILIDPNDKEHVFFSSNEKGILEYNKGVFTLFDSTNSNIETEFFDFLDQETVFALNFDAQGDLWFINSFTNRVLKEFSINGPSDNEPDLSEIFAKERVSPNSEEFLINNQGNAFLGTLRNGLIGYSSRTKSVVNLFDTAEQVINNLPHRAAVRALALDNEGELWIGTDEGLRVISDPNSIFAESEIPIQAEAIIITEDGTPQELLFEQRITDIAVDAENNKWISTLNAGVFQFSPDGQETLNQFTTANSPLPSNDVEKIAIDDQTGNVFFVTTNGLMEFKSNVVEAEENLDKFKIFPNPVRPEYEDVNVRIEGLTAGANVKITDIEGNLVFEAQNSTTNGIGSGLVEWDTRSFSGRKVASGVYLILITSEDQTQTEVGKLLIVR